MLFVLVFHVGRCPLPCLLAGFCLWSGQGNTQAVHSVVPMNSASRVINQRLTDDFRGCTMQQSAQIRRRGEFASGVRITGTQQGNGLETAGQPISVCQTSIWRDVSYLRSERRLQQTSTPSWRPHMLPYWLSDSRPQIVGTGLLTFSLEVSGPQFRIFFVRFYES